MSEAVCKVIIVDDEPIILRSLTKVIPWEALGLKLAGSARNGEAALEIVSKERPDIIISDIRMPSIDGITLMRTVMEQDPDVMFIILSGYGEFEYAREAIKHGAFNYLLKPIDHDELQEVLIQAKERIEQRRKTSQEQDTLRRSLRSLSSLVRERMFYGLIEGRDGLPYSQFRQDYWLDEWELRSPYYMGLVNLDDYEAVIAGWSAEERRLWNFAVNNILNEYLMARGCFTVFPYHNGEWIYIMQGIDAAEMKRIAGELIETIKKCTKLSVSVAISRRFEHIDSLQASYQSCREALCRRFTYGKEKVYMDGERQEDGAALAQGEEVPVHYPLQLEKELSDALRTLDWPRVDRGLAALERDLSSASAPKQTVLHILIQLVVMLHRQLDAYHQMQHGQLEPLLSRLTSLVTLEEMIAEIREQFRRWIQQATEQDQRVDAQAIVRKVLDYVEQHYDHDLGIDEVAELVGLSCSHFCVLFKQVMGCTFLEYLTKYRIDKACSILRNSEIKVFQIAPLVGYQDPRYFTQVFKKVVGKTPSEYRMAQSS